ncbi:MAG: PAS domain-containing protein, partial [Ginsengibacter sp.]
MENLPQENLQEIIKETEQRFRTITDFIPHMVWEIEPDGKFSYINKQWVDWTGVSLDDINSGGWTAVFHPDDYERVLDTWQHAFITGAEFYDEYRMKDASGKYFWFLGKTIPVKNSVGKIIKWIGTSTNIDDQKKSEEALKESETQFRQLADIMPQQVWTANEKGELDYVNLVTTNYFGKGEQEIVGAGWQSVIHPDDIDGVLKTWITCLQDLTPYQVEFRLK